MSKASIRKLFAQPPPSIEEILSKREGTSKNKAVGDSQVEEVNTKSKVLTAVADIITEQQNVFNLDPPAQKELKSIQHARETENFPKALPTILSNIESNGSSLDQSKVGGDQSSNDPAPLKSTTVSIDNKRKESDMDTPAASTTNKKLKPSSLANGVSPIQSMSNSGRSSPSVKKENSYAVPQAQQSFSFIDNLLAGLKNSAAKSPSLPQPPQNIAASITPSPDIPPSAQQAPANHTPQPSLPSKTNTALQVLSNQRLTVPVNFKQESHQPFPSSAVSNLSQPQLHQNPMPPSLYTAGHISELAKNQTLPEPVKHTKLTRKEKKKLNRKKKKQQKATLNHKDVYRDMDDLDFDTLLQQHEQASKAKKAPNQPTEVQVNDPIAPGTVAANNQASSNSLPAPSAGAAQFQVQMNAPLPTAVAPAANETLHSHTQTSKAKAKNTQPKALDPLAGYLPAKSSKSKPNKSKVQEPISKLESEVTTSKLPDSAPIDELKVQSQIQQQESQNGMEIQLSTPHANAPMNDKISYIQSQQPTLQNKLANELSAPQTNAAISIDRMTLTSTNTMNANTTNNMNDVSDNAELLLRSKAISKPAQHNKQSGIAGKKTSHAQKKGQQANKKKFIPIVSCSFFMKGFCKDGDKCTFKHEGSPKPPTPPTKLTTVCQFYKTGSCIAGDECKFSHNLKLEPCRFFHLQGSCELDPNCPYSHEPLNEDRLQRLRVLTGPCRFYHFKGYCNTGDLCMFSHDGVSEEEKKKVESTILACRFYHLKGACRSGDDCFYLHQEASPEQIKNLQPFSN